MVRLREWLKDELFRARIELLVWYVLVIPTILFWRQSLTWVVFMSVYAIIKSQATLVKTLRTASDVVGDNDNSG